MYQWDVWCLVLSLLCPWSVQGMGKIGFWQVGPVRGNHIIVCGTFWHRCKGLQSTMLSGCRGEKQDRDVKKSNSKCVHS